MASTIWEPACAGTGTVFHPTNNKRTDKPARSRRELCIAELSIWMIDYTWAACLTALASAAVVYGRMRDDEPNVCAQPRRRRHLRRPRRPGAIGRHLRRAEGTAASQPRPRHH